MSIEKEAKKLVVLEKKKVRLEKNISTTNSEITKQRAVLEKQFTKIGLDSDFS